MGIKETMQEIMKRKKAMKKCKADKCSMGGNTGNHKQKYFKDLDDEKQFD